MDTPNLPELRVGFRRKLPHGTLDILLALPGRGVSALFGPSGAGKTTCLRVLAGLERFPGATVEANGEVWQDDARGIFVPAERRRIGYVFQDACLFPHLSVRGNLGYGQRRRRSGAEVVEFDRAVELLGIGPLLERSPDKLSGGERQRVAIARALLSSPRLLLLDEPLASIDASRKREILPWLERLREELSLPMIYVSHSIDEVVRLADYVSRIEDGRIVRSGPLAEMVQDLAGRALGDDDIGGVIDGHAAGFDSTYGMLRVAFGGGELMLAHSPVPAGSRVRLRVLAHDISLATAHPEHSSILNILHGVITAVRRDPEVAHVLVTLRVMETSLVARITRLSWDRLQLDVGREVWVQLKAAAIVT